MSVAKPKLYIEIGADIKNAVKGINDVNRQIAGLAKQARMVRNIAIAATGVVVIKRVVDELGALAKAAGEEQLQQQRLARAIANTGETVDDKLTGSLEDWIQTQSRASGFVDDDLREALTQLVLETGDYRDAMDRLSIAQDAAAATGQDLVGISKLIGKADEDSISQLTKLGLVRGDYTAKAVSGFDESAAAAQLAKASGLDFAGALKVVKEGGKAGESVMKRYGVATKDMFGDAAAGAVDVKGALNELRKNVKGAAGDRGSNPAVQWAHDLNELKDDIGQLVLPMFSKLTRFGVRGLRGLRNAFRLFTSGVSGPALGSARKIWQAAFGVEMPAALGVVVDWFDKITTRLKTFVDELNSEDEGTVRGAVKKFATAMKDDAAAAVKALGGELDKLGPAGVIAKFALIGFAGSLPLAPTLELAGQITNIGAGMAIMASNLAKLGVGFGVFAIAGTAIAFLTVKLAETTGWATAVGDALTGIGVGLSLLSGNPLGALIGALIQVSLTVGLISANWNTFVYALRSGRLDDIPVFGFIFERTNRVMKAFEDAGGGWLGFLNGLKVASFEIPVIGGFLRMIDDAIEKLRELWKLKDSLFGGGGPPDKSTFVPPGDANKREDRHTTSSQDRLATLDDIYAAFTRNHGEMPEFNWAKSILAMGPMWSDVQGLAKGGIVPPTPGGTLARIGEGQQAEMVLPLSRAASMGFGGGGLSIGDIYITGDVDSRARVTELGHEFEVRAARLIGLAV